MRATATLESGIAFKISLRNGGELIADSAPEFGGQNLGPSPKEVLLGALCSCTGMDCVALFRKKSVSFSAFRVDASAVPRDEHPKVFTGVKVSYHITGDSASADAFLDCIHRSMDRYSPIAFLLSRVSPVTWSLYLNDKLIAADVPAFSETKKETHV